MSDWGTRLTLFSVCKRDQNHFDTFQNKYKLSTFSILEYKRSFVQKGVFHLLGIAAETKFSLQVSGHQVVQ